MVNKDFIIVLAWPELMCKLPGSYYTDFLLLNIYCIIVLSRRYYTYYFILHF